VSLGTAGWTAYQHFRWAKPVVKVSGTQYTYLTSQEASAEPLAGFSIDVTNVGDQATQIVAAYWEIDRGAGAGQLRLSTKGGGIDDLFEKPRDPSLRPPPAFPFTLERYQSRGWDFTMSTKGWHDLDKWTRARLVVEYTFRKSRAFVYGDWEPSQIGIQASRALRARTTGEPSA
jgi:hypothetical protein